MAVQFDIDFTALYGDHQALSLQVRLHATHDLCIFGTNALAYADSGTQPGLSHPSRPSEEDQIVGQTPQSMRSR